MPELPEVESVRLGLYQKIVGQKILSTQIKLPKIVSGHGTKRANDLSKALEFKKSIKGEQILNISRRAKNIIIELGSGAIILIHLKMTGQLIYVHNQTLEATGGGHPIELSQMQLPNKHTYLIFELEEGFLYYNDVRQFGYVLYYPNMNTQVQDRHFYGLGDEPLSSEFKFENFYKGLKKSNKTLKKLFLDQNLVVGLGNIYADEVAFGAGVRPTKKTSSITKNQALKIFDEIKRILPLAVKMGGSSVANYKLSDGSDGNYARYHMVYGRGNKECKICMTVLTKIQHAGRTTVYCKNCQS